MIFAKNSARNSKKNKSWNRFDITSSFFLLQIDTIVCSYQYFYWCWNIKHHGQIIKYKLKVTLYLINNYSLPWHFTDTSFPASKTVLSDPTPWYVH